MGVSLFALRDVSLFALRGVSIFAWLDLVQTGRLSIGEPKSCNLSRITPCVKRFGHV